MKRKYDAIDVLKLYSGAGQTLETDVTYDMDGATFNCKDSADALNNHIKWNRWLARCYKNCDINDLVRVKYGIQVGMDDVVKKKIMFNKLNELFIRWIKSIDKCAWKIIKKRNPLPNDIVGNKDVTAKTLAVKRARDTELFKFLQRTSF